MRGGWGGGGRGAVCAVIHGEWQNGNGQEAVLSMNWTDHG